MRPRNILWSSLFAAGLALPLVAPAYADIVISIDKGTQRMLVAVDGATRYDWPVSTGRPGFDTPNGTFKPNRMEAMHYSNEYEDAPMPHSMFFDMHGHAIHGFFDTPHLGMAVSHGCVRLAPANAAVLYDLVKQEGAANTTVIVRGHIPPRGPLIARRQAPSQIPSQVPSQVPARQVAVEQPTSTAPYGQQQPGYGQQVYGQPVYSQPAYGQPAYGGQQAYGQPVYRQPSYDRPAYDQYGQQQAFPPQPAPAYAQPAYGGQAYYGQSYQPQSRGLSSPY